ncbi:cell division protein FtsQ/DivIB [Winogradskyella maritima]|uniref:Cell division protein FtsQ/DivIB n=1 Tax=Winogradskyella maritima TaxID=1517766 RepID=A0ABV8AFK7_9FLAO|nr:cell division protein FtsQ/DivIB [Winogradskyella maritima]
MRVNWGYIKVVVLMLLVGSLYAFSSHRNLTRKIATPQVEFSGSDNLFLTQENVSKLLIQNQAGSSNAHKEMIDLNQLETALNSNPLIKTAQVFKSVDGVLTAKIEQKRPIARVHTNASYYVDDEGSYMPLSDNYSARVPLVTGKVRKNSLEAIQKMATAIDEDEFLKQHVTEIIQNEKDDISLKMRTYDFVVDLGSLNMLQKKINNFKAFYKKALKDKTLDNYTRVNLKFETQVICTKK